MTIRTLLEKDGTTPMGSAMNVGYPQTSGSTPLTSGTPFVAPSNGWVVAYGEIGSGTESKQVKIDIGGIGFTGSTYQGENIHYKNISHPVLKGQNVVAFFPIGGEGQTFTQIGKHKHPYATMGVC